MLLNMAAPSALGCARCEPRERTGSRRVAPTAPEIRKVSAVTRQVAGTRCVGVSTHHADGHARTYG